MNDQPSKYSVKDKTVSKIRRMKIVLRTVSDPARKITIPVIKLPTGGMVLPYFKDPISGDWKIVMIKQFRPAIKNETFEAPGGMVDVGETPIMALCRELEEETGIKVEPQLIQIVLYEYVSPPALDYYQFGGIAEINSKMIKRKKAGKKEEGEQTEIEIFNLADILKKRDMCAIQLDFLTSRLLDEVAKVAGLLIKKY